MDPLRSDALRPQVRVMQIIVLALVVGVIPFTVIAFKLANGPDGLQATTGPLTSAAAVAAIAAIGASIILPRIVIAVRRRKIASGDWQSPGQVSAISAALIKLGDEGQLVAVYQAALIAGAAILEGAAFFNSIALMLDKSSVSLAIVGLLVFLILIRLPTLGRLESWLDAQRRELEADRMRSK